MLYVVTAFHNRFAITERFIESMEAQTFHDFRLLLVDDGCTDGTPDMIRQHFPHAILLGGDGNLWWGGAMQMVYKYLACNSMVLDTDELFLCNDDSLFPPDFLEKGVRLLSENPHSLITGCGYGTNAGKQLDGAVQYDYAKSQDTVLMGTAKGNCASTRALFLTVGAMREIGGFHPNALPHYGSDYEYTLRASRKGYDTLCFEELRYDFNDKTTGFDSKKDKMSFKRVITRRSMANPFYRVNFILLSTPPRHWAGALWNQLKRYGKKL